MKTACTNSDYVKFIGFCRDRLSKLRLGDWEVDYRFDRTTDSDCFADCELDPARLKATITLYAGWSNTTVNDTSLKEIAYHEVVHILLADLFTSAINQAPEDILREHEHKIIKRMCLSEFRPRKHK